MIVLDSDVISSLMRIDRAEPVHRWIELQSPLALYTMVISRFDTGSPCCPMDVVGIGSNRLGTKLSRRSFPAAFWHSKPQPRTILRSCRRFVSNGDSTSSR